MPARGGRLVRPERPGAGREPSGHLRCRAIRSGTGRRRLGADSGVDPAVVPRPPPPARGGRPPGVITRRRAADRRGAPPHGGGLGRPVGCSSRPHSQGRQRSSRQRPAPRPLRKGALGPVGEAWMGGGCRVGGTRLPRIVITPRRKPASRCRFAAPCVTFPTRAPGGVSALGGDGHGRSRRDIPSGLSGPPRRSRASPPAQRPPPSAPGAHCVDRHGGWPGWVCGGISCVRYASSRSGGTSARRLRSRTCPAGAPTRGAAWPRTSGCNGR